MSTQKTIFTSENKSAKQTIPLKIVSEKDVINIVMLPEEPTV